MILINFKNYITGKGALNLAKTIQKYLPNAVVAVPALDIQQIARKTKLTVIAQHVSCFHKGRATGFIVPEFAKQDGAKGSLLNHSEHQLKFDQIKKTINESNKIGLKMVLCASNLNEVKKFIKLKPYAIAFEDKKLVGSGKSITEYKTKDVEQFVKLLKNKKIVPLCGAGISSAQDVKAAKMLGCKGVLIASAITNSKNPKSLLKEISKV